MKTVASTVQQGLCCSCGVCSGICPKNCISFRRKDGLFLPVIDESVCVECGICAVVCPGLGHPYEPKETAEATITGEFLACFNAWSRDEKTRHVSASGGVISTLIPELLSQGRYDGAFCLDSYDYRTQLKTRLYTPDEADNWADSKAPKSRYLPVSQEETVRYIRKHPDARLIIVGTSCALRGIDAAIRKLNRNRENYLLIGLFCDKVFNYNVLSRFSDSFCPGKELEQLHFKNKESGGWPGDMKFFPENGGSFYVPLHERARMKGYFMPERCLYCVDKLNVLADISLGDNYTETASSPLGSNSVMLRTKRGIEAWNAVRDLLESVPVGTEEIQEAQGLTIRLQNLYYSDLTGMELNPGVPREQPAEHLKKAREIALRQLRCGAVYDWDPSVLCRQLKRDNSPPPLPLRAVRFAGRKLRALWNKLHRRSYIIQRKHD
ncbi:MAG: Coenzyme F420 hydrogenase/dehydrogenase, beta subunit C-terminal domain [Oscillospiraceae bacterium]|nr:Coenzyme F420 hydrogenase/dehydrogenase, beta subunit C-terminal domain [Oscillospiraceae bacterium]